MYPIDTTNPLGVLNLTPYRNFEGNIRFRGRLDNVAQKGIQVHEVDIYGMHALYIGDIAFVPDPYNTFYPSMGAFLIAGTSWGYQQILPPEHPGWRLAFREDPDQTPIDIADISQWVEDLKNSYRQYLNSPGIKHKIEEEDYDPGVTILQPYINKNGKLRVRGTDPASRELVGIPYIVDGKLRARIESYRRYDWLNYYEVKASAKVFWRKEIHTTYPEDHRETEDLSKPNFVLKMLQSWWSFPDTTLATISGTANAFSFDPPEGEIIIDHEHLSFENGVPVWTCYLNESSYYYYVIDVWTGQQEIYLSGVGRWKYVLTAGLGRFVFENIHNLSDGGITALPISLFYPGGMHLAETVFLKTPAYFYYSEWVYSRIDYILRYGSNVPQTNFLYWNGYWGVDLEVNGDNNYFGTRGFGSAKIVRMVIEPGEHEIIPYSGEYKF